ncbi:MAG: TerB family tellurite resistance protein [Bacteroidales bacterium]|nr:TerB family tellurite resistance protein [Bacteroidales bacterium]
MGKFNKWIAGGLGWVFLGPIGGLLAFVVTSAFDSDTRNVIRTGSRKTTTGDFVISLLVLVAAVMKADGKVLKVELEYVKAYFVRSFGKTATTEALQMLKGLLERDIDIKEVCTQINANLDYATKLQMMHFLYGIAASDRDFSTSERNVIKKIEEYLGISQKDADSIMAMFVPSTDSAYKILEIEKTASDEELKAAYRTMAKKYHPDKVAYLGEDFKKSADEKFKKVNEAYNQIKKERGLN